jgi:hypothetical protein
MARNGLSKKIRFEVFKRDRFTCQYCGKSSPDVVLQVDHVHPVSQGGGSDLVNLVTACVDCNAGKSARLLSDDSLVKVQSRREQIEMQFRWKEELDRIDEESIEKIATYWGSKVAGFGLNGNGLKSLKRLMEKFSVAEILDAISISAEQYIKYEDGEPSKDSVELAWKRVGGICRMRRLGETDEDMKDLFYIRGILKNRLRYCDPRKCIAYLKEAKEAGVSLGDLREHAKLATTWSSWRDDIMGMIEYEGAHEKDLGGNGNA